ncbi:MAG TPA: hypothetical protein VFT84_15995 [Gemmatimonadales bacterium]|nr:hypothetical protein [Gemmatimonadales bacterium]
MPNGRRAGREREARLKLQYAERYPGINAGEWMLAWLLAEQLLALAERQELPPGTRLCDPAHCEFRGGGPRPPALRGLRTRAVDLA